MCIIFYLNVWLKYVVNFFFVNTRGYLRISVDIKKICRYPHNEYPHEYGDEYETNIYPTDMVRGNYYPNLTRLVDIPKYNSINVMIIVHTYSVNLSNLVTSCLFDFRSRVQTQVYFTLKIINNV